MCKRLAIIASMLGLVALTLAGCMQLASLTVAPSSAIIQGGESVTFTATDHVGNPVPVTWNVASGPGSITSAGEYTAPAPVTTVTNATVTANRVDRPTVVAYATVTIEPPISSAFVDAIGDDFGTTTYDVTRVTTTRTSDTLSVAITLSSMPTIPAASSLVGAGDLAGFICFDADENPLTGIPSASYYFCPCLAPSPAVGTDYFVSLFYRNASGNYDIYETAGFTAIGEATPNLVGTVFTLTIPLTELGSDDGITNMNTVMGDGVGPNDCAPDCVTAVVTSEDIGPKAIVIEGYPYFDFLVDLGIEGEDWLQTDSFVSI